MDIDKNTASQHNIIALNVKLSRWSILLWSCILAITSNLLSDQKDIQAAGVPPCTGTGSACGLAPADAQAGMIKATYQVKVLLGGAQKVQFAAPAIADLDHDRYQEIVVGTSDGWVYAIKPDTAEGTILWAFNTATAFNAIAAVPSATTIRAAPTVADIENDGWNEVVIAVGTVAESQQNGGMIVLDHAGALRPGWPQLTLAKEDPPFTSGIGTPATVVDLDSDGDKEIIAGSFDQRVYAWHSDGSWVAGWPQLVHDAVWTSPAVGDLDNDGFPEVVVGVDSHNNPYFGSIDGGALYVFRADGSLQDGFPRYLNESFASSPALADINNDGSLEIVIGGGTLYNASDGYKVHAFNRRGDHLPGWPAATGGQVSGSPAIADLDHDAALEVIVGSSDGKVYAWHANGTALAGFPRLAAQYTGAGSDPKTPVLVDYDGLAQADRRLEIFVSNSWEITMLNAQGSQLTWDGASGNPDGLPTFWADWTLDAPPAVADLDGDGHLELVAAGANSNDGGLVGTVYVWELPSSRANEGLSDWPMYKHDVACTGNLSRRPTYDSTIVRHTVPDTLYGGTSMPVEVVMRNTGTAAWNVPVLQIGPRLAEAPAGEILAPVGAVVAPGQEITLTAIMTVPNTDTYFSFVWRTGDASTGPFGQALAHTTKVGNVPAGYILRAAAAGGGVYPILRGPAPAIAPPNGIVYWERLTDLHLSLDEAGYFVLDQTGFIQWSGTAPDLGSISAAGPAVAMALSRDHQSYYVINHDGVLWTSGAAIPISPLPPIYNDGRMRDLALTADSRGLYVLDRYGNVYRGGSASILTPATPIFTADTARKIKLTRNNRGYYMLDRTGKVWNGGAAPALVPHYALHPGEDWARDFELTDDETGYYVLSKYGEILPGGTALPLPASSQYYWADGSAQNLELADTSRAINPPLVASTGSINRLIGLNASPIVIPISLSAADAATLLNWKAVLAPSVRWASLNASSGSTPNQLELTLRPQGLSVGIYATTLSFSAAAATGMAVSTPSIPITLQVASQIHPTFVPLVRR